MKRQITIIDYGLGNILSAYQSFLRVTSTKNILANVIISNDPEDVKNSTHVVLPGQGAFKSCIDGLKSIPGMIDALNKFALIDKRPFLGICVGMQLLAKNSEENGIHKGLGWVEGNIKKLPSNNLKLPHMGWNNIVVQGTHKPSTIFQENDYYFVHSYYFDCADSQYVVAKTQYGINFTSIVNKENIYGVQFHPEKSSKQGLSLIEEFIKL